jgi:hypothetical protein
MQWRCMGSGGIAPSFLTSATGGDEWSASFPRCYTPVERVQGVQCIVGWADPRTGVDVTEHRKISSPCPESNPGCPAHSLSLYRLSYPNSSYIFTPNFITVWAKFIPENRIKSINLTIDSLSLLKIPTKINTFLDSLIVMKHGYSHIRSIINRAIFISHVHSNCPSTFGHWHMTTRNCVAGPWFSCVHRRNTGFIHTHYFSAVFFYTAQSFLKCLASCHV